MNVVYIGGASMRFFVALLLRMTSFNCYKVLRGIRGCVAGERSGRMKLVKRVRQDFFDKLKGLCNAVLQRPFV